MHFTNICEGSYQCIQIPEGKVEWRQSQALCSGTQGQDKRQWAPTETQEGPSEHKESFFCYESGH